MNSSSPGDAPSFRDAVRVWAKIGFLSFGGPAGQISLMHRELVGRRQWISDDRFLHALNYCMLLPGPEAQQLAIYTGWLLHGIRGGIVAGTLFVLPGALLIWAISWIYMTLGSVPVVAALFEGLKPAVMAIVLGAMLRLARRTLLSRTTWLIAIASLAAISVARIPFPIVILGAACIGLATASRRDHSPHRTPDRLKLQDSGPHRHLVVTLIAGTLVWVAPVVFLSLLFGPKSVFTDQGVFFGKAALVTFGGAYAVLPYVAQQAVETHGWLTTSQMMDGLGLAETTPGPLVLVLQFVGFVAAWNHPGALPPLFAGTLGALLTSWMTFVPGFIFIFAGAPIIERTRENRVLKSALAAITAAVVGVIANLALWFAWHVVAPEPETFRWLPLALCGIYLLLLERARIDVLWVVVLGAAVGVAIHLAGWA